MIFPYKRTSKRSARLIWSLFLFSIASEQTGIAGVASLSSPRLEVENAELAASLNLLGNSYLKRATEVHAFVDTAINYYSKAIEYDPEDAGIKLNLGIAYLVIDDTLTADSLFQAAYVQSSNSLEKLFALLGLDYDESKFKKGTPQSVTEEKLRASIENSVSKDKNKGSSSPGDSKSVKKKKRGHSPAGPKSLNPAEVNEFLYIKIVNP